MASATTVVLSPSSRSLSSHLLPNLPSLFRYNTNYTVSLSLSLSVTHTHIYIRSIIIFNNLMNVLFRNQDKKGSNQKKCRLREKIFTCSSSNPSFQNEFYRRDLMLFSLSSSVASVFPISGNPLLSLFMLINLFIPLFTIVRTRKGICYLLSKF